MDIIDKFLEGQAYEELKAYVDRVNIRYSLVKLGTKTGVLIYDQDLKAYISKNAWDSQKQAEKVYDNLLEKVKVA